MGIAAPYFRCLISGCSSNTKYEKRLKHELASGVRNDSLFMDYILECLRRIFIHNAEA